MRLLQLETFQESHLLIMDTDANKMFCKSVCNYFIEFYQREYTKLGLNKSFESLYVLILV